MSQSYQEDQERKNEQNRMRVQKHREKWRLSKEEVKTKRQALEGDIDAKKTNIRAMNLQMDYTRSLYWATIAYNPEFILEPGVWAVINPTPSSPAPSSKSDNSCQPSTDVPQLVSSPQLSYSVLSTQ